MSAPNALPLRLVEIVRVSRRNKREGDNFLSTDQQTDYNRSWCEKHGARIVKQIDESDSVSGKTVDREGLQTAIKMIERGDADGVIVAKVDRFSRDPAGGLMLINRLSDHKKWFIASKDGIEISPNGTRAENKIAEAMLSILLIFARWQREYTTDGWEDVVRSQISRGIANHAPFGFRKDVEYGPDGKIVAGDRRLIPEPTEAPWVVKIFARRAAGGSWAGIRDWLIAEGVKARRGHWSTSSVKQIVENRTYLGEVRSGELVKAEAHKPLITLDLWNRANRTVTTKGGHKPAEPQQYELKSMIRCAGCGVRMFGLTDRRPNATYKYYRCRGDHGSHGRCPDPARVHAAEVEELVGEWFKRRFLGRKMAVATQATSLVTEAEDALDEAEATRDGFLTSDAAKRLLRTDISAYDATLDELNEDVQTARELVSEARNTAMGVNLPVGLEEVWDTLETDDRRNWLKQGIAHVVVARGDAPLADRMAIFAHDDVFAPRNLPTGNNFEGITRVDLDDVPASARPQAA